MIINIAFIVALSILLTQAKPVLLIREFFLPEYEYDNWSKPLQLFYELISCPWCLAFWLGLPFGLQTAVIASGINYIIDNN
jgi:hypothetical protein